MTLRLVVPISLIIAVTCSRSMGGPMPTPTPAVSPGKTFPNQTVVTKMALPLPPQPDPVSDAARKHFQQRYQKKVTQVNTGYALPARLPPDPMMDEKKKIFQRKKKLEKVNGGYASVDHSRGGPTNDPHAIAKKDKGKVLPTPTPKPLNKSRPPLSQPGPLR